MRTDELDYDLPVELIAQRGLKERTGSRLMVLGRQSGSVEHGRFGEIVDYLREGDCVVLNDSKVVPARFFTRRATGGRIEGLFLEVVEGGGWQVLLKNASRLRIGECVRLCDIGDDQSGDGPELKVVERLQDGLWLVEPPVGSDYLDLLGRYGTTPLPPYIHRSAELEDDRRYQTVYAAEPGSAAAPTAGLHFSRELLDELGGMMVRIARVTLHVGLGTFKPVSSATLGEHTMHAERYCVDEAAAEAIDETVRQGGRIVAVGTTSVRTLETLARAGGGVEAGCGSTRLFIMPGYEFKVVDVMLTNFHLPRTTLLALVCAFGGTENVLAAYREAVESRYRFFSYGDAMLVF